MKLDAYEKEILASHERGEWKPEPGFAARKKHLISAARATLKKNKRVNSRISHNDLQAIQVKAMEEGMPYQALI